MFPIIFIIILLKHILLLQLGLFYSKPKKMYYLPINHNYIIYQFVCHCDSCYVERSSQRLQERITQHVSRPIRKHHFSQDHSNLSCACNTNSTSQIIAYDSVIGKHFLQNPSYASEYNDANFSILARGRTSFHLSPFKATFIKSFQSNLYQHKEFLYSLKLIH